MNLSEQIRTESEGFKQFISDLEAWNNKQWYLSTAFQKLEKKLHDRRLKRGRKKNVR